MNPGNDLFYCKGSLTIEPNGNIHAIAGQEMPCRRLQAALRLMIDDYLNRGWQITNRNPLTLYRGRAGYQLQNGVLVSV